METKKFNSGEKARGGKNNTKTILTAAGLAAVAGAAVGAASVKFTLKRPEEEEPVKAETPVAETPQEETQNQETTQQPQAQAQTQQQTPVSGEDITTPQPIDSTGGTGQATQPQPTDNPTAQQPVPTTPATEDDIDPDLIAQQIAGSQEVDNTDIELANIITVDNMDIAYGPDGSEYTVAMFHTPDGGQFMLADTDGDGVYSDVFDLNGNYVGSAEGNLTASDLQEAADPTGGYMAYDTEAPIGEDPTNDIVATDTHNGTDEPIQDGMPAVTEGEIATIEGGNPEELVDVEDVLAQLLSSNDDSLAELADREIVVDDEPDLDDDDDDLADSDDDDDDDLDDLDDDEA
ncbi:MAG: hypothetical protein KBT29_12355 [Prevotellaceae bacterium]|nr:hypothetical protein [Candidatus Minthosoma caballi]